MGEIRSKRATMGGPSAETSSTPTRMRFVVSRFGLFGYDRGQFGSHMGMSIQIA
jgi:hypothetical protein